MDPRLGGKMEASAPTLFLPHVGATDLEGPKVEAEMQIASRHIMQFFLTSNI